MQLFLCFVNKFICMLLLRFCMSVILHNICHSLSDCLTQYDNLQVHPHRCKWHYLIPLQSVSHFSCSVMSNSLWPHGLQNARPPCPLPTAGACSDSCSLSRWCHPTISSSVVPFSSCPHSFPASGSFPKSQFFISGSQSIGISASASVLPMNIQDWFP